MALFDWLRLDKHYVDKKPKPYIMYYKNRVEDRIDIPENKNDRQWFICKEGYLYIQVQVFDKYGLRGEENLLFVNEFDINIHMLNTCCDSKTNESI